jgi:hypothetical protein
MILKPEYRDGGDLNEDRREQNDENQRQFVTLVAAERGMQLRFLQSTSAAAAASTIQETLTHGEQYVCTIRLGAELLKLADSMMRSGRPGLIWLATPRNNTSQPALTVKQTGQIRRRGTDFELGRTSPSSVLFRLVAPHFSNRDPILGRPRGVEFVGRLRLTPRNSKFGSGHSCGRSTLSPIYNHRGGFLETSRPCIRGNWLRGRDLNPRPSGYEPDELPGCSTPRLEA